MALQLDDLAALDGPLPGTTGLPLMLPVDSIDEDPDQPRREFDSNALHELAQTIRERGVRQPISVRPSIHPSGRWLLNFGARRLRAARLAALTEIPAFIDSTADDYDQVIENEQREALRPLDLALFVQKRLALGDTQAVIAKRLGKSRQYVTVATALIEPPAWLLQAYRDGRCRGKNELYELRRLHGLHRQAVERWAGEGGPITRENIAALRDELERAADDQRSDKPGSTSAAIAVATESAMSTTPASAQATCAGPLNSTPWSTPGVASAGASAAAAAGCRRAPSELRVHVELDGLDHQLLVSMAPTQPGCVYVQPLAGGPPIVVRASELKLRGFVDI